MAKKKSAKKKSAVKSTPKPEEIPAGKKQVEVVDNDGKDEIVEVSQVCKRCNGDGIWHSTKTGVRAKTSSEPLVDPDRPCPDCGGK